MINDIVCQELMIWFVKCGDTCKYKLLHKNIVGLMDENKWVKIDQILDNQKSLNRSRIEYLENESLSKSRSMSRS